MSSNKAMETLQEKLGHRFNNRTLLECALTHPSFLQEHPERSESNQRLEFLGDTILQMILTEALFSLYPEDREGQLSRRRSMLTRGAFLAGLAARVGIPDALLLGGSEESSGGRNKAAALEDAFEALVGAVYLDAGLDTARRTVLALLGDLRLLSAEADGADFTNSENPKGRLQELIQPLHGNNALRYELERITGGDHERIYHMRVTLAGRSLGTGAGSSKKAAETEAARMALRTLSPAEKGS